MRTSASESAAPMRSPRHLMRSLTMRRPHAKTDTAASVDEALRLFEQQAAAVAERVLQGASYWDALRIKENYLALLRHLEYSIKAGAVIDLAAAEQTLFDLFRGVRDAWLNCGVFLRLHHARRCRNRHARRSRGLLDS
jgi:hypothetical protein